MSEMPVGAREHAETNLPFPPSGPPPPPPGAAPPARSASAATRHLASIHAIAAEVGRPFEEVANVYQGELVRMTAQATILDYLPVLVAKHVRQLYKHRLDVPQQDDPCQQLTADAFHSPA